MVDEYLIDALAKARLEEMRTWAARHALLRAARPAARPLRSVVGMALIRAGRRLLRGMRELPAERRRTA